MQNITPACHELKMEEALASYREQLKYVHEILLHAPPHRCKGDRHQLLD